MIIDWLAQSTPDGSTRLQVLILLILLAMAVYAFIRTVNETFKHF